MESDYSLKTCRKLATQKECGYQWNKDRQEIGDFGFRSRLVLPWSRRMQVLRLAHDHHGHFGVKRMRTIIALRFTWPNVSSDIEKYGKSCLACAGLTQCH